MLLTYNPTMRPVATSSTLRITVPNDLPLDSVKWIRRKKHMIESTEDYDNETQEEVELIDLQFIRVCCVYATSLCPYCSSFSMSARGCSS